MSFGGYVGLLLADTGLEAFKSGARVNLIAFSGQAARANGNAIGFAFASVPVDHAHKYAGRLLTFFFFTSHNYSFSRFGPPIIVPVPLYV